MSSIPWNEENDRMFAFGSPEWMEWQNTLPAWVEWVKTNNPTETEKQIKMLEIAFKALQTVFLERKQKMSQI